jgi:hypothetical protein
MQLARLWCGADCLFQKHQALCSITSRLLLRPLSTLLHIYLLLISHNKIDCLLQILTLLV